MFDQFNGAENYIASTDLREAVNVSLALERPLLVKGEPGIAYNVGSDKGLSINSLAQLVARTLENPADIRILNEDNLSQRRYYVPNIQKARGLGLELKIDLESAIVKTAQWATKHPAIA